MRFAGTLVFASFAALAVGACADDPGSAKASGATASKAGAPQANARTDTRKPDVLPESPRTDAKATHRPSDAKVGVPECDEYLEKYTQCILDKSPGDSRALMLGAMDQSRKAWNEAATGPAKDGLQATCKIALEAAQQATAALGCAW